MVILAVTRVLAARHAAELRRPVVLVVEAPGARLLATSLRERLPARVVHVRTLHDARVALRTHRIDAAVVDLLLGPELGTLIVRELRGGTCEQAGTSRGIPILVVGSAASRTLAAKAAHALGADTYVVRPVVPAEPAMILRRLMARSVN